MIEKEKLRCVCEPEYGDEVWRVVGGAEGVTELVTDDPCGDFPESLGIAPYLDPVVEAVVGTSYPIWVAGGTGVP